MELTEGMTYIVRIVGPSGMERYLCRGRAVSRDNATRYPHPSGALAAARKYHDAQTVPTYVDVIDEDDAERDVDDPDDIAAERSDIAYDRKVDRMLTE